MPSHNFSALGPRWLCCACCVFGQLLMPSLIIAVVAGSVPVGFLALSPFFLVTSRHSLHILITGRPPRSGLEMSMQVLGVLTHIRERR